MSRPLRLPPGLRWVEVTGTGVLVLGEGAYHLLQGALYPSLLSALATPQAPEALALQLAPEHHPLLVFHALERLQAEGLLITAEGPQAPPLAYQAHSLGGLDPAPLVKLFNQAGLLPEPQASLRVLLVDSYLNPQLLSEAQRCRGAGISLLPLWVGQHQSWFGPLLLPKAAPCGRCLVERLWDNHPVEAFIRRQGKAVPPPTAPSSETLTRTAAALLPLLLAANQTALTGQLYTLQHGEGICQPHPLLADPACPDCGQATGAPQALELQARRWGFSDDGGYRLDDPEQSFQRLANRIDPITGLVTRLGPLPERDHPQRPVYAATHPLHPLAPRSGEDFQQISLGKGQTPAQARMSALGEALERWSARYRPEHPQHWASLLDLGDTAIAPNALLQYSPRQYAQREAHNAALTDPRQHIPLPYPAEASLSWTRAWSLSAKAWRWLPTGFCYSQYPAPPGEDYLRFSSNGNAAGQCLEEAILQGFLELVERDAVAIWWYNRLLRPRLDVAAVAHPYVQRLVRHYADQGWQLWCLDISTDLAIPVVVALLSRGIPQRYVMGFGCHLVPRLALLRALTELNQLFAPDAAAQPWESSALDDETFLCGETTLAHTLESLPEHTFGDLAAAVRYCVAQASRCGLETLVVDQTRPLAGLHAVKVVVPGLRHFWPRFGPGRLYEVPVKMGWREKTLSEEALNSVALYL